jgi:site-specific DNA-methyltransferase (adenine-specific)
VTPYYQDDLVTLYHGDALAVLAELPDASVDAAITDPPYSSGGAFRGDRMRDVHRKYVQTDSARGLAGFSGDTRDQRGYGYWCALWLAQCRRVVAPGGAVAVFTDWRQLPTTTDVMQAGGIVWHGIMPWHKPNGRNSQGRPAGNCEFVVWGTNGPRPQDGTYESLPGFVACPTPRRREHITEKPLEVMRVIVHLAPPGGVILDPFAGSGTTGVAALVEGRRFVGVELDEHHCATARRRLDGARVAPRLAQDVLPLDGAGVG